MSIAAAPKLDDVSDILIPASSPLILPDTLPPGVRGFMMFIGWVPDGVENAKGPSSSSSSSSLGVSSLAVSSCPASSG